MSLKLSIVCGALLPALVVCKPDWDFWSREFDSRESMEDFGFYGQHGQWDPYGNQGSNGQWDPYSNQGHHGQVNGQNGQTNGQANGQFYGQNGQTYQGQTGQVNQAQNGQFGHGYNSGYNFGYHGYDDDYYYCMRHPALSDSTCAVLYTDESCRGRRFNVATGYFPLPWGISNRVESVVVRKGCKLTGYDFANDNEQRRGHRMTVDARRHVRDVARVLDDGWMMEDMISSVKCECGNTRRASHVVTTTAAPRTPTTTATASTEPRGTGSSGSESSGPESSGSESSGPESSGPQSSGPQSSGPESSGPEPSGFGETAALTTNSTCSEVQFSTAASCIVFDEPDCVVDQFYAPFHIRAGESISFVGWYSYPYASNVESVSVRSGCTLEVFSDALYTHDRAAIGGSAEDVHVNLIDNAESAILANNVKSVRCTCSA